MNYRNLSAKMAMVLGAFLPIAESVRRVNQLFDLPHFFKWFDDYKLCSLLIWIGIITLKGKLNSDIYLTTAWGVAVGGLVPSVLHQLELYMESGADEGILSTGLVTFVKVLLLLYAFVGLFLSIHSQVHSKTRL